VSSMTSHSEALRLALRYIKATNKNSGFWLVSESELNKTVFAIKQALEQPEPEPVVTLEKLLEKNK